MCVCMYMILYNMYYIGSSKKNRKAKHASHVATSRTTPNKTPQSPPKGIVPRQWL